MNASENTPDRKIREINATTIDQEKFWKNVDIKSPNECWEWKKCRNKDGYGITAEPRRLGVTRKLYLTHRVSWVLANGLIPEGKFVLHHCDNPPCCNPAHYFLGSKKDNSDDKVSKGRQAFGVRNGNAILDEAKVIEIRAKHESGSKVPSIALEYDISQSHVYSIINREKWAHVS